MAHHPAALAVEVSPIVIPQGGDFSIGWIFAEGDPAAAPEDWPDGWTATLEIRETRGGLSLATITTVGSAYLTLDDTTADGIPGVEDDATVATITLAVPGGASLDWTWMERPYPFDLTISNGSRLLRLAEGSVILSEAVAGSGD